MPKNVFPHIKQRFFQAFDELIARGVIDNEYSFCINHKINRRNFNQTRIAINRDPSLGWISILVSEYKVSGDWIFTGMGERFRS